MYQPNFCAECGAPVERKRRRLWSSRRFCPACAKRFRKVRLVWPVVVGVALAGGGFLVGRRGRPAPPPLIIERNQASLATIADSPVLPVKSSVKSALSAEKGTTDQAVKPPQYGPEGTPTERPTDPNEIISICGARTKKGTPCTRRVRGMGRCWQHIGLPAMLPPSKLIVQGKLPEGNAQPASVR